MLKIRPGKRPIRWSVVWIETFDLLRHHWIRLTTGLALMLVASATAFVIPWAGKQLVDEVIGAGRHELLTPLALLTAGATFVLAVTTFGLSQLLGVAAQRAINDLRKTVQTHVTRLPPKYFDRTQSGALISRIMTDADGIRNLVGNGIVQLISGIMTALIALAFMLYINPMMTLWVLAVLSVFGIGMAIAFSIIRPLFRERREINAQVTGRLNESINGIRIVKAYTAEPFEQRAFSGGVDRLFVKIAATITGSSATAAMAKVAGGLIAVILILIGGRATLDGSMTPGDLIWFSMLTFMLAAPITQIASIGTQISEAFAGLDRIREVMQLTPEDADEADREPCPPIRGDIRFENVTFGYDPDAPVLKDINLEAPAGSTVALVGSSGAGKSTLVSLAMAFHKPQKGRVVIDGKNLSDLRIRDFRSQLGVVLQENFLFDGTIAENIAFANPEANIDDVKRVAKLAHCDVFIKEFPKGYDTIVGERGIRLSGGQRQRIAIARALLAEPRILILDEATSSLDSESEQMIQDGLRHLRTGRTTFVIAHRLSTI
ncbi:MAG: ABC transporter ATP-binding protein, partial [Phycisphaeraceae bacterium]